MEEAYSELYREFVRLRSICIRQAALLQKLLEELHSKQLVSNGYLDEVGSIESVPVQYSQGSAAEIPDRIPPLIATNLDTSPHTGQGHHQHHQHRTTAGVTTFSALLVEDMGKLGLHVPEQRKTKTEAGAESPQAAPPASRGPAEPGAASAQAHLRGESGVMQSYGTAPGQLPSWAYGPLLDSSVRSPNDGAFLSEVELQSQVCEFCHAIFPGNTATQGEFLRHLHMHIT